MISKFIIHNSKLIFTLLIPALMLVSCEKENNTETSQGHDIFYTVSGNPVFSGFSGTTAHLTTDAEFDALLDRFCDYTQSGEQVMFCSATPNPSKVKDNSSNTPTSITTSDREELKSWMKTMEKNGKTVRVTYDNGTWHGTAYTNLGQENPQEARMYTGTLAFVSTPVLENPPLGGTVWAMQLPNGTTLILTVHGMMMWNDSENPDENIMMLEGAEISLEGVVGSHTDLQGNPFMTLSINVDIENS